MNTVNKKDVCTQFESDIDAITRYIAKCNAVFNEDKLFLSYSYENAIIMVYRAFEHFTLRIMISCLNHDHSNFQKKYNINLGRHINDDVCEFIITKGKFFDFRGRSGLIETINDVIGKDTNIAKVFKKTEYRDTLEQLCALRNYAAHNSLQAKRAVLRVFGLKGVGSAGSCLKAQKRFELIIQKLKELSAEISTTPFD